MTVRVRNDSKEYAVLPAKYSIEVEHEGAEKILLSGAGGTTGFDWPAFVECNAELAPGESRTFEMPLDGLTIGVLAGKPRFWNPGYYRLRLIVGDVISPAAAIEIEQPTGKELQTWRAILDATNGQGLGIRDRRRIAARIYPLTEPDDRYRPYLGVAATPSDYDEQQLFQEKLLAETPTTHPIWYSVKVAQLETKVRIAERESEQGRRVDYSEIRRLREELEELAVSAPASFERDLARETLGRVDRHRVVVRAIEEEKQAKE